MQLADEVDRYLLMGTAIGVKGIGQDPATPNRIRQLKFVDGGSAAPPVFVDGGIRDTTVRALAAAGADGVIPGSLVFGAVDPKAGATGSLYNVLADPRLNHEAEVQSGLLADESAGLLRDFFAAKRKPATEL